MSKTRILIADDEEGVRESLNLILGEDYELVFAKDGEEALAALGRETFALVLLDIKMPKRDGLELLRWIKGHGLSTPVLMLTAYQSVELAKEAVRLGAVDYLPKPFDRDHLLRTVRGILASQ
ncbi:MAG: response regulator [Candidatus Omnitrophica bacterium]|nr:response regulator [Candidatus Omnitrophota bacterium]MBI2495756.1 response regulator [Candidatus Omnitrophota bacterium]MBI3021635.1 response regulator [Candidatus Omnitrophota bacterium]